MFELKHLLGDTYYYESFSNVGVFVTANKKAILIDSCDHKRMVKGLDKFLTEEGLEVEAIINTHCHVDHILGNRYFQDKYACKLLSTKMEKGFIAKPDLESEFYYSGINTDKTRNPFFMVEPSDTEIITEDNTPDGLEIIPLPGHSFEMIGVKTKDDVIFLADSILSKNTWDNYKFPFFHNVNKSLETLEEIKNLKAKLFVPTHNEPLQDITELADYNIKKMKEKKYLVYELCEGKTFDELFASVIKKSELKIRTEKYPIYALMVRNLLQALVDDDMIFAQLEGLKFVYHKK